NRRGGPGDVRAADRGRVDGGRRPSQLERATINSRVPCLEATMKIVTGVVVTLAACMAASATVSAQWLKYPTAGVPRLPNGKPNLNASAPRTADGKPDLSGMWDIEHNRPGPAIGCAGMEVGQEFVTMGWSLKDGLPYQPWAADARRKRMEENGKDDPGSHCLPPSIVKEHTSPLFRKIVQTPGLVVILYERDNAHRQIFTD